MTFSSSIERSTSIGNVEPSSVATVRCTIVGGSRLGEARVAGGRGFASEGSRWGGFETGVRTGRRYAGCAKMRSCVKGVQVVCDRAKGCTFKFAEQREAAGRVRRPFAPP